METAKDLFYIFSMLASAAFSIFMMWQMYKTKKAAEKISDKFNDMAETLQEFTQNVPQMVAALLPPQIVQEPELENEFEFTNEQKQIKSHE